MMDKDKAVGKRNIGEVRGKVISRREMLRLAGLGAAGLILGSCGPSGTAPEAPPTEAPVAPEATPAPTNVAEVQVPTGQELEGFTTKMAAPADKVKLVYWWGNNYEPALQFTNEIIARFSIAYPEVEV